MSLDQKKIIDFLKFIRIENGIIVSLSVIAYVYLSYEHIVFTSDIITIIIIVFLSLSGGNIINDIFDIDTDTINRSDRALVKGSINSETAIITYSVFVMFAIGLSMIFPSEAVYLVIFNTILLFFYSFFLKRVPLIGNLTVAFLSASTFIFCELALDPDGPLAIIFILTFLIHLIREIIKDIEDIEGDQQIGMKTLPIATSTKNAKVIVFIIIAAFILFGFQFVNHVNVFMLIVLYYLPTIYLIIMLYRAKEKNDFGKLSDFVKFQMILGLGFLILSKHDLTQITLSIF